MARYIDAQKALEIIDNYAKTVSNDGKVVVDAIKDIVGIITPAADVVPKSEVEKLQEAYNNRLAKDIQTNADFVRYAQAEVAREIFAELDKMDIRIVRLRDAIQYMDLVKKYEYDHKKKYTEGQT